MKKEDYVLVINPGSTSTKVAIFENNRNVLQKNLSHSVEELDKLGRVANQYQYRLGIILDWLKEQGIHLKSLVAVSGRGGLLAPMSGGTYGVTQSMIDDLKKATRGEHASNLGAMLATYNQRATANSTDIILVFIFLFIILDILDPPFQEAAVFVLLWFVLTYQHLF
jgi:butyrate kinase